MKIAVVGAGVSGLVSAYRLQERHEVVLFEGASRIGGHTNTVTVMEGGRPIPIDTGFIVFNTKTYPNFVRLLGELNVGWAESDMSFSVRSDRRDFEYNARDFSTVFAQKRNLLRPRFWRMLRDIPRFFRESRELLVGTGDESLMAWLLARGYSEAFIEDHLMPLLRAVWSANRDVAREFPARFLVRFFENHGFLQVDNRPGWLTIPGGSQAYVRAILAALRGPVRSGAKVTEVLRTADGVLVRAEGSEAERFDHVVIASHADQALRMLASPLAIETSTLGAFPFQENEAVLHTDQRLMPRRRKTWGSWNVHLDDEGADGACLTYWMNRLQPLGAERNYFVTLNRTRLIRPEHVVRTETYHHPVFATAGMAAQRRRAELIDLDGISYAGAYWRNGFHEDGVVSALQVAERLGVPCSIRGAA